MRYLIAAGTAIAVGLLCAFMGGWLVSIVVELLLSFIGAEPLTSEGMWRLYGAVGVVGAVYAFRGILNGDMKR